MAISKNQNYFYIHNGQIEQFQGVYKEGATPVRARLKDLRDLVVKCANASLTPQINEKIDKYNAKLTSGNFGWFFRLFKLEKIPPLDIKVTMKKNG